MESSITPARFDVTVIDLVDREARNGKNRDRAVIEIRRARLVNRDYRSIIESESLASLPALI